MAERLLALRLQSGSGAVPISQFADIFRIDQETRRIAGVAYEMVRTALQLRHCNTIPDEVIANRITEFATLGESNPDRLCEQVLIYFREKKHF